MKNLSSPYREEASEKDNRADNRDYPYGVIDDMNVRALGDVYASPKGEGYDGVFTFVSRPHSGNHGSEKASDEDVRHAEPYHGVN